jgi:hypothetical protein
MSLGLDVEVLMYSLAALAFALWVAAQLLAVIFMKSLTEDAQTVRRDRPQSAKKTGAEPVDYNTAKL